MARNTSEEAEQELSILDVGIGGVVYLTPDDAAELMKRLHRYGPADWAFDHDNLTLSLTTRTGNLVVIAYKFWQGWSERDYGKLFQHYHLTLDGIGIGAYDADGEERELCEIVDIGSLYHSIVANGVTQTRLREAEKRKEKADREARERRERETRQLLKKI